MSEPATQSSDRLILVAAGIVACMGLTWLVIEAPWSSADEIAAVANAADDGGRSQTAESVNAAPATTAAPETDSLYLARLALDAGMLVEPAEYSAWTLFGKAADADPGNPAAREGLEEVATALLGRGRTALEQGRLDDAELITTTIGERLPEYPGVPELAAEIVIARTPPPPPPVVARAPAPRTAAAPPVPRPVDRTPELHASFLAAMGRNAVLTPSGASARDIVSEMIELAPGHELTGAARELLVTELLDRSAQALEALDTAAAQTWIDSAAPFATDSARVARAQDRLMRHMIENESRKRLPVSALEQTVTVAPEYPETAIERDIEGWVDLEFVVTAEGGTAAITVVDASHDRYFRGEAVAAVEQWRFEPVVFMGQAIPQRAYTRLEFVLN